MGQHGLLSRRRCAFTLPVCLITYPFFFFFFIVCWSADFAILPSRDSRDKDLFIVGRFLSSANNLAIRNISDACHPVPFTRG